MIRNLKSFSSRNFKKAIYLVLISVARAKLKEKALEKLAEIGSRSSLRYSVQIPSLASQKAGTTKRNTVNDVQRAHVERVNSFFMDVSEAAEHLRKYEEKLMYH